MNEPIEAIIHELKAQEVVLEPWTRTLRAAVDECVKHNNDYHQHTPAETLEQWAALCTTFPEGVQLFSPEQVRQALFRYRHSLLPYLRHTPECKRHDLVGDGAERHSRCTCGLAEVLK